MTTLFHLTTPSELAAGVDGGHYRPTRFDADGFVHCTEDEGVTLEVARSYFSQVEGPVLVLTIDAEQLTSPWKREPPVPLPTENTGALAHHAPGRLFPHVYGAIDLSAVTSVGILQRTDVGGFDWPVEQVPLEAMLRLCRPA